MLLKKKRKRLLAGESLILDEALSELAQAGVMNSQRKWWAFEGFTSVDCYLETDSLVVLVEGKRTEEISSATAWFPQRNQIIRDVEVAQEVAKAKGKNFAVLLLCERIPSDFDGDWSKSLPHFRAPEIEELKRHYLGYAPWSEVAATLCHGLSLPDKINEAVTLCRKFR